MYESLDDVDWVLFFPFYVFFNHKTLDCGVKLEIIHKITLKDTCTRPRKYEKVDQENSELLSRNARSEMRVETGVLIERESREFQPHFLAQNLTKILILKG